MWLNKRVSELNEIAKLLVAPGKGVLAADWSVKSIGKRFERIGLENSPENRKRYREMLFGAPGLSEYISGVIEFEETIEQGLAETLKQQNILPGVKVDRGLVDMANFPGEKVSEGLDGLRERLAEYKKLGAAFCKWRMVVKIGVGIPTDENISVNAQIMARYAALCQEQGLVPIVEPEVLMDGNHTVEKCAEITEKELKVVYQALVNERVMLEGMILKTNMVISGKDCPQQADAVTVARMTVDLLKRCTPAEILEPGVVFLSGGQDNISATEHLNEIAKVKGDVNWNLTFSYERALEEPTLLTWEGKDENRERAWKVLLHRAKMNSLASQGKYTPEAENEI